VHFGTNLFDKRHKMICGVPQPLPSINILQNELNLLIHIINDNMREMHCICVG